MSDFSTLQVLGDLAGWHFDAVFRSEGRFVLVMVDTMGYEMEFVGGTVEEAVGVAVARLSSIVEQVTA